LKQSIDKYFQDERLEINTVEELLVKNEIQYDKFQFSTEWSITSDEFESKINILLEWLSLGHFKNFSIAQKNKIYSLIIDLSRYEKNKYYFTENEVVLVIPKVIIEAKEPVSIKGYFKN
jgi:hypothetical protein